MVMYEVRQNKEKVNRTIGSSGRGNIAQFKKVLLEATTAILTNKGEHKGKGRNGSKNGIIAEISKHNETEWIAKLPNASGGNMMGVCAEPHALAAALNDVKDDEKINSVLQFPAIALKNEKVGGIEYHQNEAVLGCNTCQQWAPNIGKNKSKDSVSVELNKTG